MTRCTRAHSYLSKLSSVDIFYKPFVLHVVLHKKELWTGEQIWTVKLEVNVSHYTVTVHCPED